MGLSWPVDSVLWHYKYRYPLQGKCPGIHCMHKCDHLTMNFNLVPRATRRGEKRAPGVRCSRMHQVSMVTCILLCYTKITTSFSLPAERPHCRAMLLARIIWKDLKSEIISL